MARRMPAMISGIASGTITLVRICHLLAPIDFISSIWDSLAERIPVNVLTKGAKKQTSVTMASLAPKPKPSQASTRGPIAILGVASRMMM